MSREVRRIKAEDLRPGDIVRDEEGGTGEVLSVRSVFVRGDFTVEVEYTPGVGDFVEMEDIARYTAGDTVEKVEGYPCENCGRIYGDLSEMDTAGCRTGHCPPLEGDDA